MAVRSRILEVDSMARNKDISLGNEGRWFALFILTVVSAFSVLDRQIIVILQESIKHEMNLTDTQLGMMTGLVFAFFHVVFAIPIARMADVGIRKNIVAITLAVWSFFTMLSGVAQNYTQMLLARIGVGVGESGATPAAHSMISDLFKPNERGLAFSIYSCGIFLGVFAGFLVGGFLDEYFGWRFALLAVGLPGVLLAIFIFFKVKEPKRKEIDSNETQSGGFFEVLRIIRSVSTLRWIAIAVSFSSFVKLGIFSFLPPFMARAHGYSSLETGKVLALVIGVGGLIGTISGGVIADKLGRIDKRWYLWISVLCLSLSAALNFYAFQLNDPLIFLCLIFVSYTLMSVEAGPTIAITYSLVPGRMRAMASAIVLILINVFGTGLGPFLVGVFSDYYTPSLGENALGHVLSMISLLSIVAVGAYIIGSRSLYRDIRES